MSEVQFWQPRHYVNFIDKSEDRKASTSLPAAICKGMPSVVLLQGVYPITPVGVANFRASEIYASDCFIWIRQVQGGPEKDGIGAPQRMTCCEQWVRCW